MNLPHNFKRIVLHLARSAEHPSGSAAHGYDIVAPLTPDGRLDAAAYTGADRACHVRHFREGEDDRNGRLAHRGGEGEWFVDYDERSDDDDEAGFRLGDHTFRLGDYVSIADQNGEMLTYRVSAVENAE